MLVHGSWAKQGESFWTCLYIPQQLSSLSLSTSVNKRKKTNRDRETRKKQRGAAAGLAAAPPSPAAHAERQIRWHDKQRMQLNSGFWRREAQ
jgi:hypothetical protein